MKSQIKSRYLFLIKLAIGIVLLTVLLVWNDNWRKLVDIFIDIRVIYLIPFIGLTFLLIGVSCLKWRLFLKYRGVSIGLNRLFSLYTMGIFFNNFFPSMFGGDLIRAYVLGRQIKSQSQSLASVFLERFTGLIALITLGVIAFLFNYQLRQELLVKVSMAAMGGGCLVLLLIIWYPSIVSWFAGPMRSNAYIAKLIPKLRRFHEHVNFFKDRPKLVSKAMIYSFLFHFLTAVNVYTACLVLNVPCSLWQAMVVTPIILIISSLPITPNSLGVWEWAFSIYLAQTGALPEEGLAVALLLRGKTIIVSIIGGLLFLIEGMPPKSADITVGER